MSTSASGPFKASAPALAPAMEQVDSAASVKTYHQNLASHLMSMIRQVGAGPTGSKADLTTPSDLPPNPRQHSNSSLESDSKVSSGVTTESKKSSYDASPDITTEASSNVIEMTKDVSKLNIASQNSDPASPSMRHDLTARPSLCPPKFSPRLHHSGTIGTDLAHSQPSSPSRSSPRMSPLTKPNLDMATQVETDTREQEHRRAWEAEGRRVWRHIPHGFELKLQPKKRRESQGSSASGPASILSGPSGAGPGNAIRADEPALPQDLASDVDRITTDTVPETESQASRPDAPACASTSVAKSHDKRPSTLQRRQDKLEIEARQDIESAPSRGRSREPTTASQDEQTLYNERKAARLARIEEKLRMKVRAWYDGVQSQWSPEFTPLTPPEILPHCPSPGPAMSQLRFLPLDTDSDSELPAWLEPKAPTLKLPSLHLVGETRRNRLHLIDEKQTESDVDLLIRLSDINRLHAAKTRSYAPSPVPSRSRDERSSIDDSRSHSMNVRTTMATPRPKHYTQFTPSHD